MVEDELGLVLTFKVAWKPTSRSYLDYLKYSLQETVFCATVVVDGTARYWSEIDKSCS